MPQISCALITDMRAALDDLGEDTQRVVDVVARDCDPVLGAAVMRLILAAEQTVKDAEPDQATPIWGRIFASASFLTTR